ncbi:MAG: acyl carrier protein [Saprospiraceae bacterium]|nr:acyl carrier protein [Saprospiraceae bacterium]
MEMIKIEDVQSIIANYFGKDSVEPSTRLKEDLKAGKDDIVNILASVEDKYDIVVEENDLSNLKTAKDIVKYVFAKM